MSRATCTLASCPIALVSIFMGTARADVVRRALCTKADAVREMELRSVAGVDDVCDVIQRKSGEASEERTLHAAAARSDLCSARFEGAVRSLSDADWRCSVEGPALESRVPSRPASPPPSDAGPSARTWWTACTTAHAGQGTDAGALCTCAVEVMGEAGFEERDFEILASSYAEAGKDQPLHRAGLLYGVGMMAVDVLARCGAP